MLKIRSNFNGVQALNFIHGFRHLLLFSTSTSSSSSITTDVFSGFTDYLVDFLGFSNQQAISTSTKLAQNRLRRGRKNVSEFYFNENANSVIKFFKQIGLEQSHIRNIVVSEPQILLCNVDKTLIPKIQAFHNIGFSGSDFAEFLRMNPTAYFVGLHSHIVPAIQTLREIMGCEQLVIRFLKKKCHWRPSSVPNVLVPNINLLRSYGISMESIRKFLVRAPAPFFRNIEFLENAVIKVKEELGISPQSPQFLSVVMLLSSVNENTMELKREMFRSFGWTESDISTLLASSPFAFGLSEATIKKKLDFLMNQLGYEPSYLSKRYNLLTCSLEKRILPRHKTLIVLKEKGFIKMDYLLESSVSLTESQFLKKFVLPYKEVHGVYSQHAGISLELLTLGSSKTNSKAA
ncbi:transcription termination factor MTEF1, chloroplastic-like [Chenopodium quinoa]|uniref:transcription termination factor MTEF1, chloroplastic-like n=1 Tax=Chenopodium quinoa TaxID=63459 RepID=UPI000B782EA7|nr:transcription termination factor MTEF1, chloroplastic-like [Chenopodium quinoa]XP_021723243.1 transcription termination factor MTEF1, chloroplastic-like [Chenopodium quinoa]XP_021723244.1 transcription termination factor MTEF1, chloroplastic-like [Chenopodium quinoa]XP_021723245.1 transcription termination factor MTEF1, chloroplastic-like [Chenopodium quinoa]XP_021723246.1 transcription termination factor MTEF1, chloroplastic-like [Chenopodium quinoa]XP_021723247.1 transcription termination